MLQPALLGGLAIGVLSALPVINLANCCCAWILFGGGLALWAGRWIQPLLYAVSPRDPVVFGVVAGVLLFAAGLASLLPALRASRVDPTVALRTE